MMRIALALLAAGLASAGCTASMEGATQCPCIEGYWCDTAFNVCRPNTAEDAGGDVDGSFGASDAATSMPDADVADSSIDPPDASEAPPADADVAADAS